MNLRSSFYRDLFACVFTDPAPVLEASHTLEGRLQQLQSLAPDSEALVREISGHWKKHLEYLEKTQTEFTRNIFLFFFLYIFALITTFSTPVDFTPLCILFFFATSREFVCLQLF